MKHSIVFYDASCPFCSRVVRFILKHEKHEELFFCSLQGDYAKVFLSKKGVVEVDLSTFYLFETDRLFQKSKAALRLLPYIKWYLFFLNIFWILPRFIRDAAYNIIAKNRYKLFNNKCDIGFLSKKRDLDKEPQDFN